MMDLKFCALIVLLFSCVNGSRSRFDVRCDSTAVCIDQLYYPYDVSGIKPICQNHQCVCSAGSTEEFFDCRSNGKCHCYKKTDARCYQHSNCDPQSLCRMSSYGHKTCQCKSGERENEDRMGCGACSLKSPLLWLPLAMLLVKSWWK